MSRIYYRGGMSPFETFSPGYILTHNVIGASKEDLANMGEYLEFGLDNLPPYLIINRTGNDWTKEVVLGTRNINNQRDVHARIRITNVDDGKTRGSLKTAGGTPYMMR